MQVDETVSFSGATVTTSLGTFVYDAVVGSPAIIGISGLSGEFGECCWWFTGPTTADPEDGWFSDRWTYELTNLSIPDAGILLEELGAAVTGIGPGNSLADKIMLAQTYLAVPDVQSACAVLNAFLNQVRAQRGKKLTDEQANQFTADAEAIIAAIGCD